MPGRRLDAVGDVENAAATLEPAERLRAIRGDLRLPVSTTWASAPPSNGRAGERSSGQRVSLDRREDESGCRAEAELAFFRVAQEAINNAVRHGVLPVWVRYRGGTRAELQVDDCGMGAPLGAAEAAERTGHLGLMSMSQRAEAIGADLSIGRRPGGGTRVRLVWEGAAEPASPAHATATATAVESTTEGPTSPTTWRSIPLRGRHYRRSRPRDADPCRHRGRPSRRP